MANPKAEKFFRIEFKVTGNGEFPYDMLRYDRCVPTANIGNLSSPVGNRQTAYFLHHSDARMEIAISGWARVPVGGRDSRGRGG